jgi:hypothetical protein
MPFSKVFPIKPPFYVYYCARLRVYKQKTFGKRGFHVIPGGDPHIDTAVAWGSAPHTPANA